MDTNDLSKLKIEKNKASSKHFRRRRPWKTYLTLIIGSIVTLALAWNHLNAPIDVKTTSIKIAYPSQKYALINATGYVVPQRQAAISSKAQGRLQWLGVLEGSKVKKNQIIARLEKSDVQAAYEQTIAQKDVATANLAQGLIELKEARLNVERSVELLKKEFISVATHETNIARLEKAKATIKGLKATIKSAEANARASKVAVEQTIIRAPFDGVVLTKNANVGDNITPFSSANDSKGAVVTIADMKTLEVEVDVSESNISKIKLEQACEIMLDAIPNRRFSGKVSRMVPTVDRSKATVMVKVQFLERDEKILPDMSAKVIFLSQKIPKEEKSSILVTLSTAILTRQNEHFVFLIKDHKAKMVPVSLGDRIGAQVEIKGLKQGTVIIDQPIDRIQDGSRVSLGKD